MLVLHTRVGLQLANFYFSFKNGEQIEDESIIIRKLQNKVVKFLYYFVRKRTQKIFIFEFRHGNFFVKIAKII